MAGGAANVALALARTGWRVGLASTLPHDSPSRRLRDRLAAEGVDVDGVTLAAPRASLVVVDATGDASPIATHDGQYLPFEVPPCWSSRLLLLSGLSPVVAHAAALCKAARAARRAGSFVLLDVNAGLRAWAGRDPRTIRMVLREIDAARCSLADLAVVGMDAEAVRAALRPGAVLVVGDETGRIVATGPFGEVIVAPSPVRARPAPGGGDGVMAAICAELASASRHESAGARWRRALQRGHVPTRA